MDYFEIFKNLFPSDVDQAETADSISEVDSQEADPSTVLRGAVQILAEIGSGSFGVVHKGMIEGKRVAVKTIRHAFHSVAAAKHAYREVFYLAAMDHPNIVSLRGIYYPGHQQPNDLCIVMDLMEWDLYSMTQSGFIGTGKYSYIMYQLLSALTYMHARNLIHRDVKPTNVLLNCSYMVKLCDFGRVRSLAPGIGHAGMLTPRCGCPSYEAPEMLVGSRCYTKAIDVWAAGVVLFELYTGMELVRGRHLFEQIVEMMPSVTVDDAASLHPPNVEAVKYRIADVSRSPDNESRFETMISVLPKPLQDLSRRMLCFAPQDRCTMEQAMTHPAFAHHHTPEREIVAPSSIDPTLSDWRDHGIEEYRAEVGKLMIEVNAWAWQQKEGRQDLHKSGTLPEEGS